MVLRIGDVAKIMNVIALSFRTIGLWCVRKIYAILKLIHQSACNAINAMAAQNVITNGISANRLPYRIAF